MMQKNKRFHLQIRNEERLEAEPRSWRARIKRDNKEISDEVDEKLGRERIKLLHETRADASIARGITEYRERNVLSRGDMAEILGITRRALFNYENGQRSVPSNVIENLMKRGDADLHEYFSTSPEPVSNKQRKSEAQLAITLFQECKGFGPLADEAHLEDIAATTAADWPRSLKTTPLNISKRAKRAVDQLMDQYAEDDQLRTFGPGKIEFNADRCRLRKIIRNSAHCLKCGDEVESKTVYDTQVCGCGNLTVDGGSEYLKRVVIDVEFVEETSVQETK